MPNHVKLRKPDGQVAKSSERPDVLADYFEEIQWGGVKSEETREKHKNVK